MQYSWWWLIVGLLQSLLIRHTHYLGPAVNFNSRNIRIWLLMHFLSHLQSFRENKSNSTEIIGQFYLHSTLLNLLDKVVLKWFSTQSVVIFNRQLQSFLGRFSLLLKMLFRILFVVLKHLNVVVGVTWYWVVDTWSNEECSHTSLKKKGHL